MSAQTFWKVAFSEACQLLLWAVDMDGERFRCRRWPMDIDDLEMLTIYVRNPAARAAGLPEPPFLAEPEEEMVVSRLDEIRIFYGSDDDNLIMAHAQEFLVEIGRARRPTLRSA